MDLKDTIEVRSGLFIIDYVQNKDGKLVQVLMKNPNISDEEFLLHDPYLEMIEEASKEENFSKAIIIKEMVNDYLKNQNMPTITEMRAKEGKKDIIGIVTTDYRIVLQEMVKKYTDRHNIDLHADSQKKSSLLGILSKREKIIIDMLVESYQNYKNNQKEEINNTKKSM